MEGFEIPKEIKAKPKILGLEIKELAIVGIMVVFSLTVFSDSIHKVFVIPYYIVAGGTLFYLFTSSNSNPNKKNYQSIIYFLKRDKGIYYSLDKNSIANKSLLNEIQSLNQDKVEIKNAKINDKKESSVELVDGVYKLITKTKDIEQESVEQPQEVQDVLKVTDNKNKNIMQVVKQKDTHKEIESLEDSSQEELKDEEEMEIVSFPTPTSRLARKRSLGGGVPVEEKQQRQRPKKKFSLSKRIAIAVISVISVLFIVINPFEMSVLSFGEDINDEEVIDQEEQLVLALRSYSLKKYNEATLYFDEINYEALGDDDQDVMLLAYLFGDQPEKAIELEPRFDETVISYYKATHDMEKIRDLATKLESNAIEFEIAVSDNDYEKIIELKDDVKQKDSRPEEIVNAYLKLNDVSGAKTFVEDSKHKELINYVLEYEEKENADKKKKEKGD